VEVTIVMYDFLMPTQDNKCHLLGSEKNGWSVALGQTIFADLVWLRGGRHHITEGRIQ